MLDSGPRSLLGAAQDSDLPAASVEPPATSPVAAVVTEPAVTDPVVEPPAVVAVGVPAVDDESEPAASPRRCLVQCWECVVPVESRPVESYVVIDDCIPADSGDGIATILVKSNANSLILQLGRRRWREWVVAITIVIVGVVIVSHRSLVVVSRSTIVRCSILLIPILIPTLAIILVFLITIAVIVVEYSSLVDI